MTGTVGVACAEGDWHSLPAQILAETLRAGGLVLRTWRQDPLQVETGPVEIDLAAVELDARAEEFGSLAYDALAEPFPPRKPS